MEDYLSTTRKIFAGTRYEASEEEVKRLADNMALLEDRGLGKLNKRLVDSGKKIWNTIAEHNFAVTLVSLHSPTTTITYEPPGLSRPPDFKVEMGGIVYWIQMKDLSKLERENRQDKIVQQIKREASKIKVGKFFSCMLSDDFIEDSLPELMNFIKEKAASAAKGESFFFTSKNIQKSKVEFWSPGKIALSELTLGFAGDLEIVELTGLAKDQIKTSLKKAAEAFSWKVEERTINLIVMEADNKEDIDICDAVFGTEYELFVGGKHSWYRKEDGLFSDSNFSRKVAGVIAIKRKRERFKESEISQLPCDAADYPSYLKKECGWTDEKIREALEEGKDPGPITDYSRILYVNNDYKHLLDDIKRLLSFDMVVYCNMRPPMGNGNFELS